MNDLPSWLKVKAPSPQAVEGIRIVRDILARHRLTTVCQGARCPNVVECWGAHTATFMLLGKVCTRACRFCAVPTGDPGGVVDQDEPTRLAAAVAELSLSYVVLTSVDRDDLKDGGASLFAKTVSKIKEHSPTVRVEALVPDFSGKEEALAAVAAAGADVIDHNLETVRRLTPQLRDRRASYDLSLKVLNRFRVLAPRTITKSSLILGMGEQYEEILAALRDLHDVGVKAITLGQYLQPIKGAAPVARYLSPEEFDELGENARELGFRSVIAGPLVRSSYHAAKLFTECFV